MEYPDYQFRKNRIVEKNSNAPLDRRVQKTYAALTKAFEELLLEMSYKDISISMLCDRANVRRMTFYNHFENKDAFLSFYLARLRNLIKEQLSINSQGSTADNIVEMSIKTVNFFFERKAYLINSVDSFVLDGIEEQLCAQLAADIKRQIELKPPAILEKGLNADSLAWFCAGGIIGIIRNYTPEITNRSVEEGNAVRQHSSWKDIHFLVHQLFD